LGYVVGIGTSAGWLEALQHLVVQLKPAGAVSDVVAEHLAHDHSSLSVDLLATATTALLEVAVEAEISAVSPQGAPRRVLLVVHRS
jgi:chemotaxis response regulator CheB